MNRCALALLGLLALPSAVMAQEQTTFGEPPPERLPESRFSVTPYVGARVPFTTGDILLVDSQSNGYLLAYQRGGGPMAGVDVTARVTGPFHVLAGAAYSVSREDVLRLASVDGDSLDTRRTNGPAYWFFRAGVQARLAEPNPDIRRFHPSALITVAPALVHANWGDGDFGGASSTSFAVNLGGDAAARIGRSERWSFQLGVQDYLVFWNDDDFAARDAAIGEALIGGPVSVDYQYSSSNILTVRLGVSYRFR